MSRGTRDGKAGRVRDDMEYALTWVKWKQSGFNRAESPWSNYREMKRHIPRLEKEAETILARQQLDAVSNSSVKQ